MSESTVAVWAGQMLPTWYPRGTVRLRGPGLVAAERREMVPDALEKAAETLHELLLPLGELLFLPLQALPFAHQ